MLTGRSGATLVVVAGLAAGCGVSYRTSAGGATAPPGVSSGTTTGVRFSDRGGPLTRGFFAMLGVAVAAGAAKQTGSSTSSWTAGDRRITETTTTYQVDTAAAQRGADMANAAADPDADFGGLEAGLEIATVKLGGDTSGWMYDIAFETPAAPVASFLDASVRFGVGFGRYTFHDRTQRMLSGLTVYEQPMDETKYTYIGTPVRLSFPHTRWLSSFFQADLNWVSMFNLMMGVRGSPSPWHGGVKVKVGPVFGQAMGSLSGMNEGARSVALEAGLAF
jgi:hypothetical protein